MSLLLKGIRNLSQLAIDIDKDWGRYSIQNIGAPPADKAVLARGLPDIYGCDYGLNWANLGGVSSSFTHMAYLGNGITIVGDLSGHVFRSTNYGLNWTDLGAISGGIASMAYLGNGIAIVADLGGAISRSTSAFQLWRG